MNAEGRWQGQLDPPLSMRGVAQARALAARLRARQPAAGFARLVCSDLARARQTAECAGRALGLTPQPLPALREIDAGCWSGLLPEEIARRWPHDFAQFQSGNFDAPAGGAESRREAQARVRDALAKLAASHTYIGREISDAEAGGDGGRAPVLVITHGGVLSVLCPGLHVANGEMLAGARCARLPARISGTGAKRACGWHLR